MIVIKREGYPDITEDDLHPANEIVIEMTPINPERHIWKGPKPEVLPDLLGGEFRIVERIGIGFINPRALSGHPRAIRTVIVGDEK
jgi:hypothetical protein